MVNISTMKYQNANIFDIFDALPDTLKTNLPLSDPPANKRDISCPFSCRFCFSKAEVLTLASPSTSKSWGTIWWANWRRNDANDTYTQEFLKVVHIEFWSCHMTPPLSESNLLLRDHDMFFSSLTLEAKEQIWLLKPNDGLWIPSWQFQDGHSKTRIKPMSNWLLNCCIHWIQTPIKQY